VPPTRSEAAHLRACAEDIRRSLERFPFEGVEVFDENDRAIARLAHPPVLPESSYDLDADDGLPRRVVVRMKRDVPVEAVTVQQRTWFAIQSVGSDKQPHTIERATGWRSWKAGEGTFSLENPLDALAERPTFPTCRSLSSADASALPCFTGCTPSLQRVEVRLLLRGAPVQSLSFRPHSDC
jgi:hypothetical protein